VFRWLAKTGSVAPSEMARTFNCGIGMVVIAAPDEASEVADALGAGGETVRRIGNVVALAPGGVPVAIDGLEGMW
jgi:phosphoribosylformylglycinamidine cyclo-ligase